MINPKTIYSKIKSDHFKKRTSIPFLITEEEFINWYNSQEKKCIYCGRTQEEIEKNPRKQANGIERRLSIDRLDNTKGYEIGNLGLACFECNTFKGCNFTYWQMIPLKQKLEIFKKQYPIIWLTNPDYLCKLVSEYYPKSKEIYLELKKGLLYD